MRMDENKDKQFDYWSVYSERGKYMPFDFWWVLTIVIIAVNLNPENTWYVMLMIMLFKRSALIGDFKFL